MAATQSMPYTSADVMSGNKSQIYGAYTQEFAQNSHAQLQSTKNPDAPLYNPAPPQRNGLPQLNLSYLPDRTSINVMDRPNGPTRQLRTPQSPLYVPAVLRPTEKRQRNSPPKGLDAAAGKFDWANDETDSIIGGIKRIETEDLTDEMLGPVTGLPSTNHWKPDHTAPSCSASSCQREFSFFVRRHHCRRCGNIYCYEHIRNQAPLNQFALLHAGGYQSKVCDRCYTVYKKWKSRRLSRTDSDSSAQSSPAIGIASPVAQPRAVSTTATNNINVGSVPGSVGGFNWSTF